MSAGPQCDREPSSRRADPASELLEQLTRGLFHPDPRRRPVSWAALVAVLVVCLALAWWNKGDVEAPPLPPPEAPASLPTSIPNSPDTESERPANPEPAPRPDPAAAESPQSAPSDSSSPSNSKPAVTRNGTNRSPPVSTPPDRSTSNRTASDRSPGDAQSGEWWLVRDVTIRDLNQRVVSRGPIDLSGTWKRIQSGKSLRYRNDGSTFQNREGRLPRRAEGYYREWVHPTDGVDGPGPQRIVTGAEGELYYTPDHYRSFRKLAHTERLPR